MRTKITCARGHEEPQHHIIRVHFAGVGDVNVVIHNGTFHPRGGQGWEGAVAGVPSEWVSCVSECVSVCVCVWQVCVCVCVRACAYVCVD